MARIFVTRPVEDAAAFMALCQARGFEAVATPLLTIRFLPKRDLDLSGVRVLAFTSANGVRAFVQQTSRRDFPVFAVGAASAAEARAAGFSDVRSAEGDVAGLARLIGETVSHGSGDILHPCARDLAGDLGGLLAQGGHRLRREVLYAAEPVLELPPVLDEAVRAGSGIISFFSPRTAGIFAGLVRGRDLRSLDAGVLSPAIGGIIAPLGFARVFTASKPLGPLLLDAIEAGLNA